MDPTKNTSQAEPTPARKRQTQRQRIINSKRSHLYEASDRFYAGEPGGTKVRLTYDEQVALGQESKLGKQFRKLLGQ